MNLDSSFVLCRSKTGLALLLICLPVLANSERIQPPKQVVYSRNQKYAAEADPAAGITSIYQVDRGGERHFVWKFEQVFPSFHVSDDGLIIAALLDEWNWVKVDMRSPAALGSTIVIQFFAKNQFLGQSPDSSPKKVTLDRLIRDPKKLTKTEAPDYFIWGSTNGFNEEGLYQVSTVEGRRIEIDPQTAKIVRDQRI